MTAVPAPRRSTQRGSSVSSVQSNLDETPRLVSRPAQPVVTQTGAYQQPHSEPHQALSVSSSEREQRPVPVARDRSVYHLQSESHQKTPAETQSLPTFRPESARSDSPADRSSVQRCTEPFHEARRDAASLYTDSVAYSDRQDSEIIQGEPSLPQSTAGKCGMPCFVPHVALQSLCSLFRKCELKWIRPFVMSQWAVIPHPLTLRFFLKPSWFCPFEKREETGTLIYGRKL